MPEITKDAIVDNVTEVTDFVDAFLAEHDCPLRIQMRIDVAIDEIFSNIAYYAYPKGTVGEVTVKIQMVERPDAVQISFYDRGIPYNPLEQKDPDVKAQIDDRKIGGLGIYMVKKSIEKVEYEYRDGQNVMILTQTI